MTRTPIIAKTRLGHPTIATIAAHMGLSRATVTHVLNGRGTEQRIRPETQQRVRAAQRTPARRGIASVLGVDATTEMLNVARQKAQEESLPHLRFVQAVLGVAPLPAANGSVDLLTCSLMLTHPPDLREAIHECVRVVRPGDWLLITDFHPATATFGWRTDLILPEGIYLMPNTAAQYAFYAPGLFRRSHRSRL